MIWTQHVDRGKGGLKIMMTIVHKWVEKDNAGLRDIKFCSYNTERVCLKWLIDNFSTIMGLNEYSFFLRSAIKQI